MHNALLPYKQQSSKMPTCYRSVILHILDSMCCKFCLYSLICGLHQAVGVRLELGQHYKLKQMCITTINAFSIYRSPLHTCKKCGGDQSDVKGELVPCRRCPKAFHEHCMPSSLLEPPDDRKRENWNRRIWMALFEDGELFDSFCFSLWCLAHLPHLHDIL